MTNEFSRLFCSEKSATFLPKGEATSAYNVVHRKHIMQMEIGPLVLSYVLVMQAMFQPILHVFLWRFTQNLFSFKCTFVHCLWFVWLINPNLNWKLYFPAWKTHSLVLNLVPRMLEIAFQGFEISKFPERACLKPHARGTGLMAPCWYSQVLCSNLLATSILLLKPLKSYNNADQYPA